MDESFLIALGCAVVVGVIVYAIRRAAGDGSAPKSHGGDGGFFADGDGGGDGGGD